MRAWPRFTSGFALLCVRAPGQLGDLSKGLRVVDREVGQDLAIHIHAGLPESGHETAVAHALRAGRCVDPSDPERPKLTLLLAAIAVGVPHGPFRRFLGRLV